VQGLALAPPDGHNLFDAARVADGMEATIGDIRDLRLASASMSAFRPDIVIHMAAQPLVRLSYASLWRPTPPT
jgi:CDP-glucose 4,6-dehydratase